MKPVSDVTLDRLWSLKTHVASQYQIIHDAHDHPHGRVGAGLAVCRIRKVNLLAIAEQASGQELVVDVQRCRPHVLEVGHGE